jgi:hypothetical protein
MSILEQFNRPRLALMAIASLAIASLASSASARAPSGGETLNPIEMARGTVLTQAQCTALALAVWVRARGQDFCIRYYLSTAGGEGRRPVVFLQGDKAWRWDGRAQSFIVPPDAAPYNTVSFQGFADAFSRAAGTSAIYLARPGVDGSSGHHRIRHSILELEVVNAALDAIKRKHSFEGFHLVGQSGGATLVGGLLPLRRDIGCAVPGAGRLALLSEQRPNSDPAVRRFNGLDGIPAIVRHSTARIMVVTDPQDVRVPYQHQATFVQQLRAAGGRVEHYIIEATDEHHHGTVAYTRQAVTLCIRGATEALVAANLARLVAERLAARARAQGNSQNRPQATPQPRQPAPSAPAS